MLDKMVPCLICKKPMPVGTGAIDICWRCQKDQALVKDALENGVNYYIPVIITEATPASADPINDLLKLMDGINKKYPPVKKDHWLHQMLTALDMWSSDPLRDPITSTDPITDILTGRTPTRTLKLHPPKTPTFRL